MDGQHRRASETRLGWTAATRASAPTRFAYGSLTYGEGPNARVVFDRGSLAEQLVRLQSLFRTLAPILADSSTADAVLVKAVLHKVRLCSIGAFYFPDVLVPLPHCQGSVPTSNIYNDLCG